jgi:Na+-driven multidrug efflux pump
MMAIVASCGTAAVAAYGIGLRLHMIIMMPAFAIGGAVATMVGQNLGAGRPQRARRAAWLGTGVDAAFMAVAALVLALAAPTIIRVFNADPEVVSIGSRYLRIVSPFYVFSALGIVLGRALNGAGDTIGPMVITIVCLWGLQAPLALWFAHLWQPATQGIWWAMSATMTLQALLTAAWFETGRWMKAPSRPGGGRSPGRRSDGGAGVTGGALARPARHGCRAGWLRRLPRRRLR